MDIEEFYDADPRRRPSAEIELGTEWQDRHGLRYELNYIEGTGELYVMQEPPPHEWEDPFGGVHIISRPGDVAGQIVRVVAQIDTVDQVHQILDGWPEAMAGDGGVEWLAGRLRAAGVVAAGDEPVEVDPVEVDPTDG
jgi:hypothetical protein